MILVDANLLLYAVNSAAPEHNRARGWLDAQFNGSSRVGLPWPCVLAFVRLASNPAVFRQPLSPGDAWAQADAWLASGRAWTPLPGERHASILAALLTGEGMTSRLVPDAQVAALAIEHGLTVCSTDSDFARFSGVKWKNPLRHA